MDFRTLQTAPIFNKTPKGISKISYFIEFERSIFQLKGQKYIETHNETQIEKCFCRAIITMTKLQQSFDYDDFLFESTMKTTFTIYPTDEKNRDSFDLCPKKERKALSVQKLQSFILGMVDSSETIKIELRRHKEKTY